MRRRRANAVAVTALLALVSVAYAARVPQPRLASVPRDLRAVGRQAITGGVPKVPPEFNINSGGPAVGRFVADADPWIVGVTNTFTNDEAPIGGAEDKNLPMYRSHRFGEGGMAWGYDIPVREPGTYGCTVHFAEIDADSFMNGKRVFDLFIATSYGDPFVVKDIDVFKRLEGAQFTVLTETAVELVIPGILSIRVEPSAGDAMISGVTCERTGELPEDAEVDFDTDPDVPVQIISDTGDVPEGNTESGIVIIGTEININAGGPKIGRFLAEDEMWIRGRTSFWSGPSGVEIGGAEEKNAPAVKSHRYGNAGNEWGYVIPVERPGIYDCTVHFSETDSESFKVGARVFNVMIQDQKINDIDVFRDTGEAPFTAHVETLLDLQVGNELLIRLTPVVGNAFLSAITCERARDLADGDVPVTEATSPIIESSPAVDESSPPEAVDETPTPPDTTVTASETPDSGMQFSESPEGETPAPAGPTVESSSTPAMSESPTTEVSTVVVPTVPSSSTSTSSGNVEPSSAPPSPVETSATQGVPEENPSVSPDSDLDGTPSPDEEFIVDDSLAAEDGEVEVRYDLSGTVTDGTFSEEMSAALKEISGEVTGTKRWALISVRPETDTTVLRQAEQRTYQLSLQALYPEGSGEELNERYSEFVEEGEANDELRTRNIDNLDVSFRSGAPTPDGSNDNPSTTASTSTTKNVVGIVVGSVLGLLVVVALVAFFVVRRNRGGGGSGAAFDGPPPATAESEASSALERSETAASVEYLDDDSTFTAATSRAGDNVDQVAFDKDVFGRGTAAGAHGTS